ncbi:N-acetylmuramic acid 6-phosphate etherase [Clostridium brassicae]|uniref:N-acetylmuramic acid 6-phosphate etherase n=1 Tax=Clostridium brassicae TaxID=2999072 RepID=A0ABT4DGB8_9CLOT|nr:N-acetylmuramic acid 6-phosphate etherase [Clostridium brassicae]MCY6960064.1 N-acetylmuramic acid 6-phosphate etherase [Clostridium brassicae]
MNTGELSKLATEQINKDTTNIDSVSTLEMIEMINKEDKKVAEAVEKEKENIAKAVDAIAERLRRGGRLIYVGAGTSGRIGILDASECPPTYGVSDELVQGIIAGGNTAIFKAVEGAEDNKELGAKEISKKNLSNLDVVCGIAASGRTPYVIGAMEYGKKVGARVLSVTMSPNSEMANIAHIPITVLVGPEAVTGSTRMKCGTAQKMVLNMLSTGTMIKLGKVYNNLMVDVQTSNEKLVARAKRILKLTTDADDITIDKVLRATNNDVKLSIVVIKTDLEINKAKELLHKNCGYVKKCIV